MDYTQENIQFSDKEILTKIWIYPRQVFKFINEKRHNKLTLLLSILVGISSAFDSASNKHYGDKFSLWAVIGIMYYSRDTFWLALSIYLHCFSVLDW